MGIMIALPIFMLLLYISRYYTLKHDYKNLGDSYKYLIKRQEELMKIIKDNDINTIEPKMSENEERNEEK